MTEDGPNKPGRRSGVMAVLPWLLGAVIVLTAAAAAGLGTAYLIASFRAAPTPQSLITPTPVPRPSPTAPPSATESPAPSETAGPAATATVEPSPGPEATPIIHIVQRGESLSLIAAEYGVTLDELISFNQLQNPNLIVPGQEILIPPPSQ
jgi:LysM repeat protein